MKRNGIFSVSVTYVGCFLGAGFVSGQELWQFFGVHGKWGFFGLGISILLFFLAGYLVLRFAADSEIDSMDRLVVWFPCRPLRVIISAFEVVFLFMIYLLMSASIGSLLEQILGLPTMLGSAVCCLAVALLSLLRIEGIVRFFSGLVPTLVLFTVIVSVLVLVWGDALSLDAVEIGGLLGNHFALDAVTYVTYNIFCAVPILVLLGGGVRSRRSVSGGIFLGCVYLLLLMGGILLAMMTDRAATLTALPMVELAFSISRPIGIAYTVLLALSIIGAALSSLCAVNAYFSQHTRVGARYPALSAFGTSILAFAGSIFGFKELVGVVYPICGYVGILPLLMITVHAFLFYRKRRREQKEREESAL